MSESSLSIWFKILTIFFAVGSLALLSGGGPRPEHLPIGLSVDVVARPIAIPPGNLDIPTGLSLRLTNAWELTSVNGEFGGLSALQVSGGVLTFLSDRGALVRLLAGPGAHWHGSVGPVPLGCGVGDNKHTRDTESIASDARQGTLWIGFEGRNAICRVASPAQGGTIAYGPPAMRDWDGMGGPEAMARLTGGSFLIFAEGSSLDRTARDLLFFDRSPADPNAIVTRMRYRPPTGFLPVDAAQLPDGRILVLNRRFSLPFAFSARLSIIELPKRPRPGAILAGPIVARLDGELLGENFEGLAIDNDGQDLSIWLVSDSNFLSIQRTFLLRLAWPGAARVERNRVAR